MKKKPLTRLVGRIEDVQIGVRAKGVSEKQRPVSIQVRLTTDGKEQFEWFALGRELRLRVKELVPALDTVMGQTFEFYVSDDGQIEEFRRLLK